MICNLSCAANEPGASFRRWRVFTTSTIEHNARNHNDRCRNKTFMIVLFFQNTERLDTLDDDLGTETKGLAGPL